MPGGCRLIISPQFLAQGQDRRDFVWHVFWLQVTWHGMKCDRIVSWTNTTHCESKRVCGGTAKRHENTLPSVGRVAYEVGLPAEWYSKPLLIITVCWGVTPCSVARRHERSWVMCCAIVSVPLNVSVYQSTRRRIPEDSTVHKYHPKTFTVVTGWWVQ
jgi:hypothetical protein